MPVFHLDYSRLDYWRHTDIAYILQDKALKPYINRWPSADNFDEVIRQRSSFPTDRTLLLNTLQQQYSRLGISLPVTNETLLSPDTFTIATAHQPSLLLGPLYYIYKIASIINAARQIQALNPGKTILPVFIIGGEDHDWEEVNHFQLFGITYTWDRQSAGAIGRLSLDGLQEVIDAVNGLFVNSPFGNDIKEMLETSLRTATRYADFQQLLLHHLFHQHGLVVLNMDDPGLKRAFIPIMEKELLEQFSFTPVTSTQKALDAAGFKAQAYCRPINLFYLTNDQRERIDIADGQYIRVDSGITYTRDEMLAELNAFPERFSPNVILRPLYQEFILPNLAYTGGGGELAYWLERKAQFEAAGIPFPVLIRRNSLLLIDDNTHQQMGKAEITWEELLEPYDTIAKSYLLRHANTDLHFDKELDMIRQAYQQLSSKAEAIDPTLSKAIMAEETRQLRQFEQLASRLLRAEKQQQETALKRIQKLKDKLFPGGSLQERRENFLAWYARLGPAWIEEMIDICDPFPGKFIVVVESVK